MSPEQLRGEEAGPQSDIFSFGVILHEMIGGRNPFRRNTAAETMLDALWQHIDRVNPGLIGLSVPFPGNVYGAFRIAKSLKERHPGIAVALGGGYVNTELRRVSDPRVFDYVDFITLDDGERPLLSVLEHLSSRRPLAALCRTYYRDHDRVQFSSDPSLRNLSMITP